MKQISVVILKRRLRQAAWLPLIIIVVSLLCSVAFILKGQFDERLRNTSFALSDTIDSNRTAFSQELLLNQPEAIGLRLSSILKKWNNKFPGIQACMRISIKNPPDLAQNIEGCSFQGELSTEVVLSGGVSQSMDIKIGTETLATFQYAAIRSTTLADIFPPALLMIVAIALATGAFAHALLVRKVERTILEPLLSKISEDERMTAIAETAQMLAHDIRKPLQAIRMALRTLVESRNRTVHEIGERVTIDVEGNIRSINAMLSDIIDVSKEMKLTKENISLKALASSTTEEVLRLYPSCHVTAIYQLESESIIGADREKVARVISNLTENALQAIGERGTLRISARDVIEAGTPAIEVSVANDGPVIGENDLPNLFAPFFTKRKKGTGLGLSIVKKIVAAHGGTISCSSTKEHGTIFSFTLPATVVSRAITTATDQFPTPGLKSLHEQTILVFDDEKAVHSAWREHEKTYSYLTICHFMSWEDFVASDGFGLAKDAIAFVDIYYKGSKSDGFDIARALRKLGVRRLYAITSAKEEAKESGLFDGVYGKQVPENLSSLVVG